ncbi:TetR/AcrR family transcriptional regulator; helix-turn-helix transcriptional regulator [Mycolicibacterium austroafricanum]|nr:helix-turn-helix transcriptional regulator [Mycolicibacterium austroafricanum]QZT63460.1 TetR/AcrR family transcriptional regulator; helix-turn-helix transcriptional regulator [Mycolicibacterium austroafricanum]QZT69756.1 TetR/AcrR family transcriptional regulator; helix-turn-helix transcriptional regulator [Mycolicibacterium austroafricanum]
MRHSTYARDRCTTVASLGRLARINEPRRKPRQRRSRETVNTLVEAAAQLFSAEGIAATTNRIAERAGTSIGTLYQYFPDKFALLRAVADRHVRDADRELTAVFAALRTDAPPFDATMGTVLEAVVTLHAGRPKLHALLHRLVTPTAEQLGLLTDLEDRLCSEVAFHLKRCGRSGADVETTARTLVHTVDAQLHRVLTRDEFDVGDARDALMVTVSRLAPPPG